MAGNNKSKVENSQSLETEIVTSNGVKYSVYSDGTAAVTRQLRVKLDKFVKIAADLRDGNGNTYAVTKIVDHAFSSHEEIEAVEIDDGILEMGNWAFLECKNLNVVKLPIGIDKIGTGAFEDCESLQSVVVPDGVNTLASSAFKGCKNLSEVVLPDSLKRIDISVFKGCGSLTSLTIPASVERIRNSAFDECPNLKEIKVDSANTNYYVDKGRLVWRVGGLVVYDPNKKEVIIPEESIDRDSLIIEKKQVKKAVQKGDYVYYLGVDHTAAIAKLSENFKDDKRLIVPAEIDDGDGVTYAVKELNHILFYGVKEVRELIVSEGIETIGKNLISNCGKLKKVSLPSTLKSLGISAFFSCVKLKEVDWNGCEIKRINKSLFYGCNSMKTLALPDTVEEIGELAISFCKKLQNIILPQSLKRIGKKAFAGNLKLKKIFIPASVEEISEDAFDFCGRLKSIVVDSANPKFSSSGECIVDKSTGAFVAGKRKYNGIVRV